MAENAQSRREQHKQKLRAELLAAAHSLVKEEGYDGLTIRRLAKRVGYAPMSVYSYFADKQHILAALAEDVFDELARRSTRNAPDDPLGALRHGMQAFAAFGLENANEYRIIFMTPQPMPADRPTALATRSSEAGPVRDEAADDRVPATGEKKNPALKSLRRRVRACLEAGELRGDEHAVTTVLWTTVHGAVSAMVSFPQYSFGDRAAYADMIIDLAIAAVRERPPAPLEP